MMQPSLLKLPDLRGYENHRVYLQDVIDDASRAAEKISMERFAKAFGLGRSHLSMVLSGDRDLTLKNIHGVARALHFKQSDHEYWETLCLFGQAKDDLERNYYKQRLATQNATRITRSITTASKLLTSQWYIPAILVYLIDIGTSDEAQDYICQRLGLDKKTLKTVMQALEEEGFLSFRDQGNVHISFNRLVSMISNRSYLKRVFEEGVNQMEDHFADKDCLFNGTTFSVGDEDIAHFISDYKMLLDRYMNLASSGKKRIVQANIQFFRVF